MLTKFQKKRLKYLATTKEVITIGPGDQELFQLLLDSIPLMLSDKDRDLFLAAIAKEPETKIKYYTNCSNTGPE